MKLINIENLSKEYPDGFVALNDITCAIDQGEFVSLVGSSGAGKSTFLKMVYAEEFPTDGAMYFGGRDVADIKRKVLPHFRRNFGTVFQDFKLLSQKTIFENVAYTLEVQGKSDAQIEEEVHNILRIVGLDSKADKYPHQISGGEQQRASLARAVIHRPRVLIADEPTGNLDPISALDIVKLLLKINSFGTTVILATHDKSIVDKLNRRVILMDKGHIIRDDVHGKYIISG